MWATAKWAHWVFVRSFKTARITIYVHFQKSNYRKRPLKLICNPVWNGTQALIPIERVNAEDQLEQIAEGYEQNISLSAEIDLRFKS